MEKTIQQPNQFMDYIDNDPVSEKAMTAFPNITLSDLIPKIASMENEKIREERRSKNKEDKYRHWASNASYGAKGSDCLRKILYYALKIPREKMSDRFYLTMDDSSWHEYLTLDWLSKSVYQIHSKDLLLEPFVVNGETVRCRIDTMLTDPSGNDVVIEHKALNDGGWGKYYGGTEIPWDYFCQTVSYIVGLHKITGKWVPGILLIKNKNSARYLEYHCIYKPENDTLYVQLYTVDWDDNPEGVALPTLMRLHVTEKGYIVAKPDLAPGTRYWTYILPIADITKRIIANYEKRDKYISENKLPAREYDITDWHCSYCGYKYVCWGNYKEEIAKRKVDYSITDEKILEKSESLNNIKETIKILEKQEKILTAELTVFMQNQDVKSASAKRYGLELKESEMTKLDKKKIPLEILAAATVTIKTKESLNIFDKEKIKVRTKKEVKSNG